MKKPIIIIFAVILAIHLLGLGLFMAFRGGGKEEEPPSPETPSGFEKDTPPEPTLLPPESGSGRAPVKRRATPRMNRVGTPKFSFDGAAGKISGLPFTGKAGILVDLDSGKVLWASNANKSVPIASMTKMMTALLAFEDIRAGKVSMDSEVKVSKKASAIGGSDIWLDPRESFKLRDLLKAMLIKSANDAAYQVAEYLGGSGGVAGFVKRMNSKASELGMKHTRFHNPHGLPETPSSNDNAAACRDLVVLAALLSRFPEVLEMTSTRMVYISRGVGKNKKTQLVNTNNLVRRGVPGVDGMKTGYTRHAGSCLTATCRRGGRRLIAVVAGFKHASDRDVFVRKLLDWGYKRK